MKLIIILYYLITYEGQQTQHLKGETNPLSSMNDLRIFKTRRGPGILAKLANGSRQQLHDRLRDLAVDFFTERGLIFVSGDPDFSQQTFGWRVFLNDGDYQEEPVCDEDGFVVNMRVVQDIPSTLHSIVAGVYRGKVDTSGPLVPHADYPVAWVQRVWDLYTLHFRPRGPALRAAGPDVAERKGLRERDAFYDFARSRVR